MQPNQNSGKDVKVDQLAYLMQTFFLYIPEASNSIMFSGVKKD